MGAHSAEKHLSRMNGIEISGEESLSVRRETRSLPAAGKDRHYAEPGGEASIDNMDD